MSITERGRPCGWGLGGPGRPVFLGGALALFPALPVSAAEPPAWPSRAPERIPEWGPLLGVLPGNAGWVMTPPGFLES